MERHYSYFIVKPDGMRFLDDICDTIEERYTSVRYYAVEDFKSTIKSLYYKHYEKSGEKFGKSFESYLYGLTQIFGNQAILAVVSDEEKSYEELMQSVLGTKLEIRDTYINNNVGIVTDYGNGERNYIKLVTEEGGIKSPRIMKNIGNHRISDLNVIHSPDANLEDTLKELQILINNGIIDDKNMITPEMLKK